MIIGHYILDIIWKTFFLIRYFFLAFFNLQDLGICLSLVIVPHTAPNIPLDLSSKPADRICLSFELILTLSVLLLSVKTNGDKHINRK